MRFPILSVTPPGILMPGLRCGAEAPSLQPGLQILRPLRGYISGILHQEWTKNEPGNVETPGTAFSL
jgi:hypothetical protein